MGFDYSCHPIDENLIKERILPFVMGDGNIDDLVAEAIRVRNIAHECKRWARAVSDLESRMRKAQMKELPRELESVAVPVRKKNFFDKILRRTPPTRMEERTRYPKTTGIPGYDCDLHLYGRPFFIDEEDSNQVAASYQKYLLSDLTLVPNLALEALESINAKMNQLPSDVSEGARKIMQRFYPLRDHLVLPAADLRTDLQIADSIMRPMNIIRDVWLNRNQKNHSIVLDGEQILSAKCIPTIPYYCVMLAASLIPGWMGRGYNTPSSLLSEVGVDTDRIFVPPTRLFESVIAVDSRAGDSIDTHCFEHNSLGGYVEPKAVGALVALLEKHKDEILHLYAKDGVATESQKNEMLLDWRKAMEPAHYALKHGFGFMEASDIYSGFLGDLN